MVLMRKLLVGIYKNKESINIGKWLYEVNLAWKYILESGNFKRIMKESLEPYVNLFHCLSLIVQITFIEDKKCGCK